MNTNSLYEKIKDEIVLIREDIHQYPEAGFEETKTAEKICGFLKKYGIRYTDKIAKTGICAIIGNEKSEKVLLIRADMDALPVEEKSGVPYSSKISGMMHACGHDVHISSALAAAFMLKQEEENLGGCVKVVFQPAEETTGGAKTMIDEGVLQNPKVTAAIGGHVTPMLDVGKVWLKEGALMASPDDFEVKFIGKSTHGAEPQNGISPILPSAEFTVILENEVKSKISEKDAVLSICTISGGNSVNIIPEIAKVVGTFRSFSNSSRETAAKTINDLADKIAKKYGAKAEVKYNFLYPPVINDKSATDIMREVSKKLLGEENTKNLEKPLMTGEDFSYFAQKVPSCFVWYGCRKGENFAPLHSECFIADNTAIEVGANLFYEFAKKYFTEGLSGRFKDIFSE